MKDSYVCRTEILNRHGVQVGASARLVEAPTAEAALDWLMDADLTHYQREHGGRQCDCTQVLTILGELEIRKFKRTSDRRAWSEWQELKHG